MTIFELGYKAQKDGVKWWNNPYPSGGKDAYEWDKGHTRGRKETLAKSSDLF